MMLQKTIDFSEKTLTVLRHVTQFFLFDIFYDIISRFLNTNETNCRGHAHERVADVIELSLAEVARMNQQSLFGQIVLGEVQILLDLKL